MRRRVLVGATTVLAWLVMALAGPMAVAQTLDEVAVELDATGRYVEFPVDDELEASIQRANSAGIAFVWLDQDGDDAAQIATGLAERLAALDSRYGTVVVLNNDGVWVTSRGDRGAEAGETSRQLFAAGAVAAGLDQVTAVITGADSSDGGTTATSSAPADAGSNGDGSSGSGVPWLWIILLAVGGFFFVRFMLRRRRTKRVVTADMEVDRAEIKEQLRNNADRVIDLGDLVIANGDPELIRTYEKASQTYQDVSMAVDEANDPNEIDRLDDRIDEAEWQFEVIEARLEGRRPPNRPPPGADEAVRTDHRRPPPGPSATPPPPGPRQRGEPVPSLGSDEPALGPDESAFDHRQPPQSPTGRSGGTGGLGGMLGGVLAGALGSILMGGMRSAQRSRRSQRRSGGYPGSLGGGVLRGR